MKVLTRDKIVESVNFPLSEALTFAILLWTMWGLTEAFWWQKLAPFLSGTNEQIDPHIYIASFLLYLLIAAVLSIGAYSIVKLAMVVLDRFESYYFRGITLSLIVLTFFALILTNYLPELFAMTTLSKGTKYAVSAVAIILALLITGLLFRWASGVDFRIRRTGTIMLTVLIISLLLSFVRFPLFSEKPKTPHAPLSFGLSGIKGVRKLAAYNCLSAYFPSLRTAHE